jgi:predicted dehydrogenase/GT2 family glycosyltransferase
VTRPRLPLTSIIMLTRNRAAFTSMALESIAATRGPLEWIIVDNGSTDETRGLLERWARDRPAVQVLRNDRDPGSSRARNQGLERAHGDLVLFVDNDVLLDDPLWLEKLAMPILEPGSGRPVATAPLLLFPGNDEIVQSAGGGVTSKGWVGLLGRGRPDGPEWATTRQLAWAPTAALLVRRDAALAAGGFDEAFDPVSIGEDIDLCCRLRAAGGEILFVGTARLRHYESITFNHLGCDKRAYWLRHMRIIRNRWFGILTRGPLHSKEDIAWWPVTKDYANPRRPLVHVPEVRTAFESPPQFFTPFLDVPTEPPPPLRVGIVGCGQAAVRGALPAFSRPGSEEAARAAPFLNFDGTPNVIVAAVFDVDGARAQAAARQFGARRVESSYEDLIARVPLEAVCICSPPAFHAAQCAAAVANGIPVLVEKPPVTSEQQLDELLAAKRGRAVPVMVNIPWVFHPALQAARRIVASGRLGRLRLIDVVFEHPGPQAWSPTAQWYFEGGLRTVIHDLGLHVVLALEELTGLSAAWVASATSPGSGLHARGQCVLGEADVYLSIGWDADEPRFSISVDGSLASLRLRLIPWRLCEGERHLTLITRDEVHFPYDDVPFLGGPYRHFIDSVRAQKTPLTDLDCVAGAMRTVLRWAEESSTIPA